MTRIPIHVPEAPSTEPLRLGEWSVEVGDFIEAGDRVAELISSGFTLDLLAPAAGTLRDVLRQPEQLVRGGEILGWIDDDRP